MRTLINQIGENVKYKIQRSIPHTYTQKTISNKLQKQKIEQTKCRANKEITIMNTKQLQKLQEGNSNLVKTVYIGSSSDLQKNILDIWKKELKNNNFIDRQYNALTNDGTLKQPMIQCIEYIKENISIQEKSIIISKNNEIQENMFYECQLYLVTRQMKNGYTEQSIYLLCDIIYKKYYIIPNERIIQYLQFWSIYWKSISIYTAFYQYKWHTYKILYGLDEQVYLLSKDKNTQLNDVLWQANLAQFNALTVQEGMVINSNYCNIQKKNAYNSYSNLEKKFIEYKDDTISKDIQECCWLLYYKGGLPKLINLSSEYQYMGLQYSLCSNGYSLPALSVQFALSNSTIYTNNANDSSTINTIDINQSNIKNINDTNKSTVNIDNTQDINNNTIPITTRPEIQKLNTDMIKIWIKSTIKHGIKGYKQIYDALPYLNINNFEIEQYWCKCALELGYLDSINSLINKWMILNNVNQQKFTNPIQQLILQSDLFDTKCMVNNKNINELINIKWKIIQKIQINEQFQDTEYWNILSKLQKHIPLEILYQWRNELDKKNTKNNELYYKYIIYKNIQEIYYNDAINNKSLLKYNLHEEFLLIEKYLNKLNITNNNFLLQKQCIEIIQEILGMQQQKYNKCKWHDIYRYYTICNNYNILQPYANSIQPIKIKINYPKINNDNLQNIIHQDITWQKEKNNSILEIWWGASIYKKDKLSGFNIQPNRIIHIWIQILIHYVDISPNKSRIYDTVERYLVDILKQSSLQYNIYEYIKISRGKFDTTKESYYKRNMHIQIILAKIDQQLQYEDNKIWWLNYNSNIVSQDIKKLQFYNSDTMQCHLQSNDTKNIDLKNSLEKVFVMETDKEQIRRYSKGLQQIIDWSKRYGVEPSRENLLRWATSLLSKLNT